MTLEALAAVICKSKSTVSKYENGEIPVDIETLYEIASALQIHVEQLLYCPPRHACLPDSKNSPAFFAGCSQFYAYVYDGRNKQLIRCVFDSKPKKSNRLFFIRFVTLPDSNAARPKTFYSA